MKLPYKIATGAAVLLVIVFAVIFIKVNYFENPPGECYFNTHDCTIYFTNKDYAISHVRVDTKDDISYYYQEIFNYHFNKRRASEIDLCEPDVDLYTYRRKEGDISEGVSYGVTLRVVHIKNDKTEKSVVYSFNIEKDDWNKTVIQAKPRN